MAFAHPGAMSVVIIMIAIAMMTMVVIVMITMMMVNQSQRASGLCSPRCHDWRQLLELKKQQIIMLMKIEVLMKLMTIVIVMTMMIMMDPPGQTDEVLGQRGLPRCNPCNLLNPANG